MGKKLVGVDGLDAAVCHASGKMYVDGSIILTPGAKDELTRRGIAVVYGPNPHAPQCAPDARACPPGLEDLILAVSGILKTQYGIEDPEQLRAMSRQVVDTIRENI